MKIFALAAVIAVSAYDRLFRPDVDSIIAAFVKAQTKLEKLVDRERAQLASGSLQMDALFQAQMDGNRRVDRAYRLIHNLDRLTA